MMWCDASRYRSMRYIYIYIYRMLLLRIMIICIVYMVICDGISLRLQLQHALG